MCMHSPTEILYTLTDVGELYYHNHARWIPLTPPFIYLRSICYYLQAVQYHSLSTPILQAQHTFLYFNCFWHVSDFMPFSRQTMSHVRIILLHNDQLLALKQ